MTIKKITWQGVLLRFLIALALVFCTYNPYEKSYFHWLKSYLFPTVDTGTSLPMLVLAGVVLVIGWTIYLRATMRSLGLFGLILAASFFGALLWLAIDFDIVSLENIKMVTTLILIIFAGVLATGISWSHIRRRITGQLDVDDVDS